MAIRYQFLTISTRIGFIHLWAMFEGRKKERKGKKKYKYLFALLQARKTIRARDTEPTNEADSFQFLRCRRFVGKDEERVKDGLWVGDSLTPATHQAFMHADVCTFYILPFLPVKPRFQRRATRFVRGECGPKPRKRVDFNRMSATRRGGPSVHFAHPLSKRLVKGSGETRLKTNKRGCFCAGCARHLKGARA